MLPTKGRILFVEDYADTRAIIAFLLEGAGYQVTTAETIGECLNLVETESFDLYVLDHVMSDGSGIALCRQLRESDPDTPIIFFSAAAHPAEQQAGLDAGASEYLVKPRDILNIPEVVARLIRNAQGKKIASLGQLTSIISREELTDSDVHFAQVARQFAELFHALPVACFIYDRQGRIVEWNRASELFYGWSATEVFSKSVAETIICPEDENRMGELVERVLAGETLEGLEFTVQRADGNRREVLCNTFPLYGPHGQVIGGINASMDITERKRQEQQLKEVNARLLSLALTDGLTSVKNHRAFKERLAEEFARAVRYHTSLSLILLDVDRFKDYNDAFGHPAGDEVLKTIAGRLQETVRDTDFVARYGGEEFAILLPHTDAAAALISAERLRSAIEESPWPNRAVTASLGVATVSPDMANAAALIVAADRALYTAKANGRDRVAHADGL
ncbi:MAG: diguanylate cyclase [Armatimonadota bacterium]|nr:diguanylate cyclase [Armatimonadota bacterium]